MAKTANPQIDIFDSPEKAQKAFNNSKVPCQLLYSNRYSAYFIDRSKKAIIDWPFHYELLKEK